VNVSEWREVRLGDVIEINKNSYSASDNWDYINYLDTGNITENRIDSIQYLDLKTDKIPSRAKRKVNANDIIYSTVRPNQRHYGIIKKPFKNMLVSTGFAVINGKDELADNGFLYWYLTQNHIVDLLHTIGEHSTSAYPSIKPSDIEGLDIMLPPLPEQKAIAATLSAIDDMIELNNQINKTLEEMAQAIFKSWFVNFEPFKDGEFEESELGLIPKGWRVGTVGDLCTDIFSGGTPLTSNPKFWNGKHPWLASGETRTSIIVKTEKSITDEGVVNSSTRLAKKYDIVIASAGQGHTRGQTAITLIDTYINQSVIALRAEVYGYLFCNLRNRYNELRAISDSSSIRVDSLRTMGTKMAPNAQIKRDQHLVPFFFVLVEWGPLNKK